MPGRRRLLVALALLVLAPLVACDGKARQPPAAPRARPSVVLVTLDTLRADRLGCYGSKVTRTPAIDRLAAQGTLFENDASAMPSTRPSHFSILTSLYPRDHGVLNNSLALAEGVTVLPELFRQAGYRTAGFVGVKLLGPDSGAARGFEQFDSPPKKVQETAEAVVGRAIDWLGAAGSGRPFFLWVHLYDPHMPYAPPPPFNSGADASPPSPPAMVAALPAVHWSDLLARAEARGGDLPRDTFERAVALYGGEVEYVDHEVGRLLEALDGLGLAGGTAVVLTADHGECFDHGIYFQHGECLYEGATHVPLIVRYPGVVAAGARAERQVESLDIAPTLLGFAGLPVPAAFQGRPLIAPAGGADLARWAFLQRTLYTEVAVERRVEKREALVSAMRVPSRPFVPGEEQLALRGRQWKYIATGAGEELYDLSADPGETTDLAASRPEVVAELRPLLRRWAADHPLHVSDAGKLDPEVLKTLKSLGYVQ